MKQFLRNLALVALLCVPWVTQGQQSLPYTMDFEDETEFSNWTMVSCASSTSRNSSAKQNGSYGFQFYYNTTPPQYLISPELSCPSGVEVVFAYKNGSSYTETFKVGYSSTTNDVSAFTWGSEITAPSSWTEFTETYPAGTKYIAIAYTANDQFKMYVDDIVLKVPASCFKPTAAEATNLAVDGATISWTRDARNAAGETYTIMNGSTELGTTAAGATSFNVTGLTANTEYTLTIVTNCAAGDESVDNVQVTFTTLANCATPVLTAGGVTNIAAHTADVAWTGYGSNNSYVVSYRKAESFNTNGGLNETFNGLTTANSIPEGWNNSEGTTTSATSKWSYNTTTSGNGATNGTSHDNTKCVRFDSYNNSSNNTNFLQTPSMDFPAGKTMKLSFWWKNPAAGDFSVYISTDGGTTKTPIAQGLTSQTTWTQATYILADYTGASNVTILFEGTSNYGYGDAYIYLDDVAVGYDVAAGAWQEVPAATASVTLTGLESETEYEVKVKGLCDDDVESDESAVVSFTTLAGCMVPTALTVAPENITTTTAVVSWTNGYSTDDAWEINYRVSGAAEWTVVNATANPHTLTGLNANTAYEVRMRTNCGAEGYSDWTATVSFRTACGQEAIPFTENFDSYAASTYSSAVTPDCWMMFPEPTNYFSGPCVYSNGVNSSRCLYTYGSSAHNYVAVLPEMSAATNTLQVRFQYKGNNTSYTNRLEVGYVTDVADTTTFVSLWSVSAKNSSFTDAEVTLENAPAGARIAFRNNTTYGVYIDNITVETIPACKNVTGVAAATNITSTGATLSWTDERNEDATYTVYNNATEPATALGTTEAGVTTIALTGLTANTPYNQLVIVANCSENEHSGEVSVPSFTTKRNECAITAVSVTAPAGVTRGDVVIDAENHSVTIPVYYMSAEEIAALTGSIGKSTGATIYAYNATTSDWTTTVYSLAGIRDNLAMNTPYTVRVVAEDPAFYQDWTITLQGEACSTPRNLTFVAERTRLTANWVNSDPAAEDYQVVISPSALDEEGLAAAVKTAVDGATTYTFTGLLRETEYHVYVRTNCGNDTYSGWTSGSVTTKGLTFCEDVTVVEGSTTNANIPLRPYYLDSYNQHTQLIYTATDMAELEGMQITSMTFYTSFNYTFDETPAVVKLGSTTLDNLTDAYASTDGMTTVSNALINIANNKWVITFDAPYTYTGGNLLIDITTTNNGECSGSTANFYGRTATANVSRYMSGSSNTVGTASTYQPKVNFTYCAAVDACPAVAEIEVSDESENGATVEWTASAGDYVSGYQVIYSETELDAAALEAYAGPYAYDGTALTCDLTGLTAYTNYYIYVRANCGAPDNVNSTWQSATFRTLSACGAVADLAVEQTGKTTVVATWTKTKEAQASNFNYILSTDEYDVETQGDVLNGMPKTGAGLEETTVTLQVSPSTHYYLYVQNYCAGEGASPWKSADITTYHAMPAVVGLTATEITHTAIAATWQKNVAQFADETQWQVAAVLHGETPAAWTVVSDTHYTFVGLTPETTYDLYVRPYQANPEAFGAAALHEETTTATPGNCTDPIGQGTSTSYGPICGYYGYERNVYLFTAEDGLTAGNINKIAWNYTSAANVPAKIYLKNTDATALSTDGFVWNTEIADASLVYDATASIVSGWNEFDITPFNYTGAGLIVYVASSYGGSGGGSVKASLTTSGANNHIYIRKDNSIDDDAAYSTFSTKGIDNQRHNVKFCYAVDPDACRDVTRITVSDITTNGANVSWMPGNTEVEWIYNILNAELGEPTGVDYQFAETPYVSYDALLPDHDYRFWVRPWVNGDACGNWRSVAFQTVASCGLPTVLAADGITTTTATLHALAHPTIGTAQNYTFRYWKDGEEDNKITVNPSVENSAVISNLLPNTTYWYDVMVSCGASDNSRWSVPMSFITECAAFTEFPWSENFDTRSAGNFSDHCWENEHISGGGAQLFAVSTSTLSGNNTPQLQLPDQTGGTLTKLRLPEMTFTADQYQFVLDVFRSNSTYNANYPAEGIRVYLSQSGEIDDDAIELTFIPRQYNVSSGLIPAESAIGWYTYKLPISVTGNYYIVLRGESQYCTSTNMDNFVVRETPKYSVTTSVTMTGEDTPAPMGSIASTPATLTDVYDNTEISLTATPEYGYEFVNWTEGDAVVSTDATYQFKLDANRDLVANFDSALFTITAVADDAERGTAYGTATVKFNLPVMLTARANTGYHFVNWTSMVDGVPVEAAEPTVEDTIIVNAYRDSTFTANFDTNEYHVTVFVEGQEMGTVDGPEFVKYFTSADYVPTAYYGYHFVNWTDVFGEELPIKEGTENTLTISNPVKDTMIYANFDYDRFTVTAETDNMAMGSVDGTNEVNYLETVTLTATPEVGYHFVNWTRNGAVVSTNATMDVVADSNYTFIAHFDTNVYHVNVIVNNTMGSVSGPVTVKHFLSGNYEATANDGYHFVNWTDSVGNTLGATALLTLYPESDTSIYANFAVNTYALTVNVAAECEGWGSVSGSNAAAEHFQNYQISATPEVGYHFVQWQDGNDDNPRTVTLTEAKTYTATFDTNVYELNVVSANTVMGSVSGSVAEAKHFLNYEISATANYGYHFTGWNDNNKDNPRTVTLTESKTYTANFDYDQFTVNGVSSNNDWGSVSGSATVNYLTPVTLTATPEYGYVFVSWKEADTVYSTNATVDVEANAARTLTAVFAKDQFTVTASVAAGCETMGTVAPGSTTAEYMTPVTLTATPEEGYHLVSWSNGATTNQITVYADSTRALVATFAINVYDITISYDAQRGTVTNDDDNDATVANGYVFENVEHGTVLHLTATVDEGSRFAGWNDGIATVTTESIAYTATATRTLAANFIDAGNYQVTLNYNNVMGTVTGGGERHADNDVTITATPNYGYHFVAWVNESGDSINTATYTFTMPQSEVEFTAVFDYNQYTLTVASADTVMGTVTDGATVNYLSTVPVNATNKYGYHFTHWYGNGINDTVATTASATIQVLRDSTVTANFDYNQYAISAVSADETKGSVSGSATANYLSHVTLTATPAAGYHFVKWTNAAGAEVGTAAELDVEVREAATFTAYFEETLAELAWSAESFTGYSSIDFNAWAPTLQNPHNVEVRYGAVEDNLAIDAETGVIGAEMENGHAVMRTGTYHIYAVHETSQDYYYDSVSYTLTVENGVITVLTQNIDEGGVVSFPDYTQEASLYYHYFANENSNLAIFAHGTDMRAEATAATGFEFVEWQAGDNVNGYEFLSTDNPVTYTLPDSLAAGLKAIFDTVEYDVTVMVNEVEGSVEGPATVKHFLSGTYTATATPCYHFLNWTNAEGTVVLGTEPTLTIAAVSDSTIKANFELNVYTGDTTVDVCDEFEWHGVTYTTTPEEAPTFVYSTVNGCDSTVTLYLTIRHSQTVVLEDPIIACDSVEWNGTWYYESGEQSFTTDGANGCDSTTTVMLTINHSNTGDTTAVACNSFDWYEYTEITASTEELTHVFTNAAGCDSVVTLHLTVNYSNTGDTTATACDSFDWYGESYDESGDYTTTLTNVAGCDSVVTLHLTVNYSNTGDTTATACDSFDWYGESYDESGDYTTTLTNVAGCDSVVTLHLTINHSQTVTLDPVSAYDSYEWNGETYTESGQLIYNTVGANGCDSTTTVMLTINHYDSITVVLTINDATMGTTDPVAGTYRFYPGDAVSATATANTGYSFVGWAVTAGSLSDTLPNAQLSYEFVPEMAGMTLYVEAVFVQDAVGIENVDYSNLNIYGADNKVYVKGAEGMTIYIYDVNGRCMARRANASDSETFTLNMTGVILVKAGNAPAKRVVLVR